MNEDWQAIAAELAALKKQIGMTDETLDLPPQRRFSPQEVKELVKFEQFPSEITVLAGKPPGNKWAFRPYPRTLYRAQRHPSNGKWVLHLEQPRRYDYPTENQWEQANEQYRHFSEDCLRIVSSEREHDAAKLEGWRDSAAEALEFRELEAKRISDETAEGNYRDKNMSEKALAEKAEAEAAHFGHLPEIPVKPKRKYTRKNASAAA